MNIKSHHHHHHHHHHNNNNKNKNKNNNNNMRGLIEGAGYKYLGIIQADQIRYTEMKEKVKTEYLRRVRKVLETNTSGESARF